MFFKIILLAFFFTTALSAEGNFMPAGVTTKVGGSQQTTTTSEEPTTSEETTTDPTTTTTAPTTTTTAPTTTTASTTTTTTTTASTTTTAPTTTLPPPSTTPVPPSPWVVRNESGDPCIIFTSAVHIDVPYKTNQNKTGIGKVEVAGTANVSGNCSEFSQMINLNWDGNSLSIAFSPDVKSNKYWVSSISAAVAITPTIFPNISDGNLTAFELTHQGIDFVTPISNSFTCSSELQLNMNVTKSSETARISFKQLKLDAFHSTNKTEFSAGFECDADRQTPDIVPIAVGCAIATLIIVVLIAYLVSRRRTQARGYLSM